MSKLKKIKLVKRPNNTALESISDEQLMRIGELALSRYEL